MTKEIQMIGAFLAPRNMLAFSSRKAWNLFSHMTCFTHSCNTCRVFEKDGVKLVVDNVSYDFVKGATVDYVEELIRSAFLVISFLRH